MVLEPISSGANVCDSATVTGVASSNPIVGMLEMICKEERNESIPRIDRRIVAQIDGETNERIYLTDEALGEVVGQTKQKTGQLDRWLE